MNFYQKLAWGYALLFLFVVSLAYIPGLTNDQGLLLGGFKIDPIDDLLHGGSALWAAIAAWHSTKESRRYFQWFGSFYTLDAFVGFFTGLTILDVLTRHFDANIGYSFSNIGTNFAVNLPHFIIGPLALFIGYLFKPSKKLMARKNKK